MNTKLFAFSLISIFAMFLLLAASPPVANASNSWSVYHWARTANPFTLQLGNNTSGTWTNHFATVSSDWSQSAVLDTTIVAGGTTPKSCRPTSGRVEVCNANYNKTGWLGIAQIWITGGTHITQGIVKNNDYYFGKSTYAYNNEAEKLHVICQEVGHMLGLDHQNESGISLNTCMDYYHNTSNTDTRSTRPNQHDYDQLATIYAHFDSSSTVGTIKAPANSGEFNAPDEWGKLMRTVEHGRSSIYERELGGGHKLVTYVIWAQ